MKNNKLRFTILLLPLLFLVGSLQAITIGYTFTDGEQVNATKLNLAVNGAAISSGEVSNSMLANSSISTAKIQNLAVDSTKLADGSVIAAKLGPLNGLTTVTTVDESNDYLPIYNNAATANRKILSSDYKANFSLPPGIVMPFAGTTPPTGWLLCSGLSIGNASSGGTARANADTQTLYVQLWNSFSNTTLQVQDASGTPTVRGANALADFNANKRMPLPDMRGRAAYGRDDMGGTAASRITNAGTGNPGLDGTSLGAAGGVDRYALTIAEMPAHTHPPLTGTSFYTGGGSASNTAGTASVVANFAATTGSTGGGAAHAQLNPAIILNYIIKL